MSLEDIELENLDRIERLLIDKYGSLSNQLAKSIATMRGYLELYEVDKTTLDILNDEMYKVSMMDDVKKIEVTVKKLADTFWD